MKKSLFAVFVTCLAICCLCTGCSNSNAAVSHRYEGDGFSSPEDAVEAYVDALQNKDLQGIISTYAVETYVDHFSADNYIQYISVFSPTFPIYPSIDDHLLHDILLQKRVSTIWEPIYELYLCQSTGLEKDHTIMLKTDSEIGQITKKLSNVRANPFFQKMEIVSINNPTDVFNSSFSEKCSSAAAQKDIERGTKREGCDERKELIITLRLPDSRIAYQFLDCYRYGNKWFVGSTSTGFAARMAGVSEMSHGFVLADEISYMFQ